LWTYGRTYVRTYGRTHPTSVSLIRSRPGDDLIITEAGFVFIIFFTVLLCKIVSVVYCVAHGEKCVIVPNFVLVAISRTVAKIWRFDCFQIGSRLPHWIFRSSKF